MLRVADMLIGKPLLYLIALEQHPGRADAITELGYDARTPSEFGIGAHYVNLRDERNSGRYGPYLPPDDIDEEYNEPAPDPDVEGPWYSLEHTFVLDEGEARRPPPPVSGKAKERVLVRSEQA